MAKNEIAKRKVGRPSSYNDELIDEAYEYLTCFLNEEKRRELVPPQVVPTIEGMCFYINRARSTIYSWKNDEDKSEFMDIVEGVNEMQSLMLQNGGLGGHYNPSIVKLLLTKHGYSDKVETDHKNSDGSLSSKDIKITVTDDDIKSVLGKC